jgi:hypothetical protein
LFGGGGDSPQPQQQVHVFSDNQTPSMPSQPEGVGFNIADAGTLQQQPLELFDPMLEESSLLEEIRNKKIALQNFPTFDIDRRYANEGGPMKTEGIASLMRPELDRDTIPAMLTEDEHVITRGGILGLDLMMGGNGDFTRGHEIVNNIQRQGEDYLDGVLNRPLFNRSIERDG